ncbi:MAG: exo-alpha-sialidase [Planctomycetes bacterium]|nr:exo-alpha-sialidase [Planctomycetota bacterium]
MRKATQDVLKFTPDLACLAQPLTEGVGAAAVYGCGFILQLSSTQAALFLNLRISGVRMLDFEGGSDVIIFNAIGELRAERALPLTRNEIREHPETGRPMIMVKYPVSGGFVPLGAKLKDGRDHPHAGTGFGLVTAVGFPEDRSIYSPSEQEGAWSYQELHQYRFDGERFSIESVEKLDTKEMPAGMRIINSGCSPAIPSGEDLLFGVAGGRQSTGVALSRWSYGTRGWAPVSLSSIDGEEGSYEPSLVRCRDGSIVATSRNARKISGKGVLSVDHRVCIYKSKDEGRSWCRIGDKEHLRSSTPLCLNQLADGSCFVAANPERYHSVMESHKTFDSGEMREALVLYPLDEETGKPGEALMAMDCNERFGPSPGASMWRVDHPFGACVRLADGAVHSLLCMRICERLEVEWDAPATPQSACWIGKVGGQSECNSWTPWDA